MDKNCLIQKQISYSIRACWSELTQHYDVQTLGAWGRYTLWYYLTSGLHVSEFISNNCHYKKIDLSFLWTHSVTYFLTSHVTWQVPSDPTDIIRNRKYVIIFCRSDRSPTWTIIIILMGDVIASRSLEMILRNTVQRPSNLARIRCTPHSDVTSSAERSPTEIAVRLRWPCRQSRISNTHRCGQVWT